MIIVTTRCFLNDLICVTHFTYSLIMTLMIVLIVFLVVYIFIKYGEKYEPSNNK